jgi:hypothetical protein
VSAVDREIVTRCICPPIPDRRHDWLAYFEDEGEERGNYGYGATEQEAVDDLVENRTEEDQL